MNLSMRWLKDYVNIDVLPKEFADEMTMSGSKVEGYKIEGSDISKVVVGKILSVKKHENAEKLQICSLDVGSEAPVQIVTAATNINVGDIVPVALHGAILAEGKKITSGKLRGEVSNGMLCSIHELGLTLNDFPFACDDGIFILDNEYENSLGKNICDVIGFNDTSVEFEITSNRPDCLSVIGLARETAVTFNKDLILKEPVMPEGTDNINDMLKISIKNTKLCPRYMAAMVKNIRIAPSPLWLRERLRTSGVRPINNIVDITNYVMLEYGHPMHAFDYKFIENNEIIVRNALKKEKITTLDSIERNLSEEMLVIADSKKAAAVAGVMGGEFSSIMDDTKTIVFESAFFNGPSIRRTSKKLGLRTDSSSRFEKGLDPNTCEKALIRALELVKLLDAGDIISGIIDCNYAENKQTIIPLNCKVINDLLGTDIDEATIKDILIKLDFKIEENNILVPSFRADVLNKYDIAEEIARIYGYNNIPSTQIKGLATGMLNREQIYEKRINSNLLAQGYSQIITYSFISPKFYDKILMEPDSPLRKSIVISNPLGEDTSIMRTTALPSMLNILSQNYKNRNLSAKLYEIATVYIPTEEGKLPIEKQNVVIGEYGEASDFYTLKGTVCQLLSRLNINNVKFNAFDKNLSYHPGRCAEVIVNETVIGILGEIHPAVTKNYDINTKVYSAVISFNSLLEFSNEEVEYKQLPKFPAVTRDLALICDDSVTVATLEDVIKSSIGKNLEKILLFDIYKGEQIAQNKKSVAFNLTLRSQTETLTDIECDKVISKCIASLNSTNIELRS